MAKNTESDKGGGATVSCVVCHKEIPASTAISPEGHDYVVHICGGECHAKWERERAAGVEKTFERRSGVKPGG